MKERRPDCIISIICLIIALVAKFYESDKFLFIVAVIMCLSNALLNIKNLANKVVYVSFFALIFLFLLSRDVVSLITEGSLTLSFSHEINKAAIFCIILSMAFLAIGSFCSERIKVKFNSSTYNSSLLHKTESELYKLQVDRIKNASRVIMYISFLAALAVSIEQAIYVSALSYYDLYLTYASNLPGFIVKIGDMYPIAFFCFLACLPKKVECRIPIFLYALIGIVTLGTGQRNQMMIHLIVIVIYLMYRQSKSNNAEIWLPKRYVFAIVVSIPFVISFLFFWGNYRIGNRVSGLKYSDILVNFLSGQGKTIDIIGYTMVYNTPKWKFYSFGDIIDFFINSYISKNILGIQTYKQYTPEYALNMHSFGQYITYVVAPTKYLSGGGIGSSYIAEAFVDFGYLGIVLWSFAYGVILTKLSKFKQYSWIQLTFLLFAISKILMAPRTSASGFIASTFSFINLATILIIYLASKTKIGKIRQ